VVEREIPAIVFNFAFHKALVIFSPPFLFALVNETRPIARDLPNHEVGKHFENQRFEGMILCDDLRGLRGCTRGCVAIPAPWKTEDKPENQSSKSYLQVFGRYLSHFVIPDIFYRESIFSLYQVFNTALAVSRTAESEKIQQGGGGNDKARVRT
jgi:hypothetical protein